ncbi:MAG: 4-(cytidine 5'-diphospho)-2-C-methyl-D-erythritol kinase [Actinobacteria bacterium]|nr:4-(cytidine 5'-diphospho)-2-C-methyl-D-erythritol kinase [Actinomycetota bacterium]
MSKSVTVRVPAKVNVYLGVGPREFSGYHQLATVFQAVNIYDEITVESADELSIVAAGQYAQSIPCDESNLVWKAAKLVAAACGIEAQARITITKSIPVAAGMAGGSADAAAALLACDALWNGRLSRDQLDAMAQQLGSDVPFMLHGGCALGTNRGEVLAPIMTRAVFHWVFATFKDGLATPAVYERLDNLRGPEFSQPPQVPDEVLFAITQGDSKALGKLMKNDLQLASVTMKPILSNALEFGLDNGALGAIVSGSGPTCAYLVKDEKAAIDLAVALSSSGLVDKAIRAHGPVHGARILPHI